MCRSSQVLNKKMNFQMIHVISLTLCSVVSEKLGPDPLLITTVNQHKKIRFESSTVHI